MQKALNANVNIGEGINLNALTNATANAVATNGGGESTSQTSCKSCKNLSREFIKFYAREYFSACDYCHNLSEGHKYIDAGIQAK